MKAPDLPAEAPSLSIVPTQFAIVFADDSNNPLSFVSPPIDDISEMAEIERSCFSLSNHIEAHGVFSEGIEDRLGELLAKESDFYESATFFNRIANLHRLLEDRERESAALARAGELSESSFFVRRIGENLIRRGSFDVAEEIFHRLSGEDSYSALRLASLCMMRMDLNEADNWVARAVELNPSGYAERLFQGATKLIRGEFTAAIGFLRMALEDRPTSSVAYYNLGLAYLGNNLALKAFESLKKSVALDPFNRSAVLAISDVANLLNRDADVVSSLRYFVEFEQRDSAVWGRLARALLRLDLVDECIRALKRQGALEKSVSVWNNLGVAYAKRGLTERALQALNHALTIDAEGGSHQEFIVARNIVQLISSTSTPDMLLRVTSSLVEQARSRSLARDPKLCDIYGFHIGALIGTNRDSEALALVDELLGMSGLGDHLNKWIVQSMSSIYSVERNNDAALASLVDNFTKTHMSKATEVGLYNNLAFAYAELGRLEDAENCIQKVSHALHRNAYLTATFGLIKMKRGRIAQGQELYKEAIQLAPKRRDKARIRQKFNLEMGRYLVTVDSKRGVRALQKAAAEKEGEPSLVRQAERDLRMIGVRVSS